MINVIAYYPGAGGNRYLRYLHGQEYQAKNVAYDQLNFGQLFINRYLLDGAVINSSTILTHCLNEERIKSLIGNCQITLIVSDKKKSLHREWKLLGHARAYANYSNVDLRLEHYNAVRDPAWPMITTMQEFRTLPSAIQEEVDIMYKEVEKLHESDGDYQRLLTAFATVHWHDEYYKKYPVQYSPDVEIINVEKDHSEFALTMQRELAVEIDPMFELACTSYYHYGAGAELTTIYEQYKK